MKNEELKENKPKMKERLLKVYLKDSQSRLIQAATNLAAIIQFMKMLEMVKTLNIQTKKPLKKVNKIRASRVRVRKARTADRTRLNRTRVRGDR